MDLSPIILGLKCRFGRRPRPDQEYRIFATAFDEVLGTKDLARMQKAMSAAQRRSFDDASKHFDCAFLAERLQIAEAGASLVRDLNQHLTDDERHQTVVSFLIDHSGSMRGMRMIAALLAVEGAVDTLGHAAIATEILGFTTASWKGGKSRRAWRWAGRPSNPGRLCDLRHIVYGQAQRTHTLPWQIRLALCPGMLHENIDGEALAWAAGRLDSANWPRRVICLVSDGMPIDDSTLLANDDDTLLSRHLEKTIERLEAQDVTVATLQIGEERGLRPNLLEHALEPEGAGTALIRLLRRTLMPTTS